MAISDALHAAHENLLRVLRPLTPTEVDDRVFRGLDVPSVAPDVDPAALHDGARRFVDALSADPAAAAELTRRGTLCATLTREGSEYSIAKTNAQKALREWNLDEQFADNRTYLELLHKNLDVLLQAAGEELVAEVRDKYGRMGWLLSVEGLPEEAHAPLEAWRDAAWQVVSQGENDSLDGCYWLLHADNLQNHVVALAWAPEVRQAAKALVALAEMEQTQVTRFDGVKQWAWNNRIIVGLLALGAVVAFLAALIAGLQTLTGINWAQRLVNWLWP